MAKKEEPTFEAMFTGLEEHARKLEDGKLPLDTAISLYEEGVALAEALRKRLEEAELRVQRLQQTLATDRAALRELEDDYEE